MRRYQEIAFRTAFLITEASAEAEDAAQEGFIWEQDGIPLALSVIGLAGAYGSAKPCVVCSAAMIICRARSSSSSEHHYRRSGRRLWQGRRGE